MGRHGLYYHTFGLQIGQPFKVISYPLVQLEGPDGADVNIGRAKILLLANKLLEGLPITGANPEIFWFQVSPIIQERSVMRMCFFEAFQVVAMSSATLEANI